MVICQKLECNLPYFLVNYILFFGFLVFRFSVLHMFKPFGIIEERESPYNGRIVILGGLEGPRIVVGGLSQSGWLVRKIWKTGIKRVARELSTPRKVLILGLGGGSSAELVQEFFPEARMEGVEIDPQMVEMGKKYLKLGEIPNLDIIIADALKFVPNKLLGIRRKKTESYDLVLVDLFVGTKIPKVFKEQKFLKQMYSLMSSSSIAAFNHFYGYEERDDATKFLQKLRRVFPRIVSITEEANIVFLCFKN